MKTIEEEYGIVRGGLLDLNTFSGETEYYHGFFLYENNLGETFLCYKEHWDKAPIEDQDTVTFYNPNTKSVQDFWDGIIDGNFKYTVYMIASMDSVPYCYYTYLRESKYGFVKLIKKFFSGFVHDMNLLF